MKFTVFQVSRKGGREKNEDRMGYCYTQDSGLFLLADGMGGHPDGEVAAQIALQAMSATFQSRAKPVVSDVAEFLSSALVSSHHHIIRYASEKGLIDNPRTTLVAVVLQEGSAHWVHCGDSRLYFIRDGVLLKRSRDHSYAEHPDLSGSLLEKVINRNILFTCLGSATKPLFDVFSPMKLQHRDKIFLCSDGLWDQLSEAEIVEQLTHFPVAQAVPELVERALRKGGDRSDNVTAMGIEWEAPDHDQVDVQQGVSTGGLSDGVFASTIQAGGPDGWVDDLDDEAIERSIAEINEAIRRGAAKRSKS